MNRSYAHRDQPSGSWHQPAVIRPPSSVAPSKAMLAICSDLDETPDAETYFETIRFLNSTEETKFGRGVGLNVGNTIYFDMPPGHFSYWNANDRDRGRIRDYIKRGWIDCIHSYGDLATTRAHAGRALDELAKHNCWMKVWVDHSKAPTNFGVDIMCGHGDDPTHPAYHADLTMGYGIKYIWRGRVTSVIGQDRSRSLRGIFDLQHPIAASRTVLKECIKQILGTCGNTRYRLHANNRILAECKLRDGSSVLEFLRSNSHWEGVSGADRGDRVHEVLTPRFLDKLIFRGGKSILYSHLGKLGPGHRSFSQAAANAFKTLAEYHHGDKLLLLSTTQLLKFCSSQSMPQKDN